MVSACSSSVCAVYKTTTDCGALFVFFSLDYLSRLLRIEVGDQSSTSLCIKLQTGVAALLVGLMTPDQRLSVEAEHQFSEDGS